MENLSRHDEHCGRLGGVLGRRAAPRDPEKTQLLGGRKGDERTPELAVNLWAKSQPPRAEDSLLN